MITEDRIREALHEATARVEVDEDLAWQRAWLGVAREPIRRVRRTSTVLAVAASIAVVLLAWQLFARGDSEPSVRSDRPAPAADAPKTVFDSLAPNDVVDPAAWVSAANALASARGDVSGVITLRNGVTAEPDLEFSIDRQGQYLATRADHVFYGLAGSAVEVDSLMRIVRIETPRDDLRAPVSPLDLVVRDSTVDRVLRPGAWVAQELAGQKATITFLGRAARNGRSVDTFRVTFDSTVRYAAGGWDLDLDTRTGVLLGYVVRYSEGGAGGTESAAVHELTERPDPLRVRDAAIPGGYRIAAIVGTGADQKLVESLVPAAGSSVGATLEQVRSEAK